MSIPRHTDPTSPMSYSCHGLYYATPCHTVAPCVMLRTLASHAAPYYDTLYHDAHLTGLTLCLAYAWVAILPYHCPCYTKVISTYLPGYRVLSDMSMSLLGHDYILLVMSCLRILSASPNLMLYGTPMPTCSWGAVPATHPDHAPRLDV